MIHKKYVPLPLLFEKAILGYGVMVTLQILVLPFLVRVRVAQQEKSSAICRTLFCIILFGIGVLLYYLCRQLPGH